VVESQLVHQEVTASNQVMEPDMYGTNYKTSMVVISILMQEIKLTAQTGVPVNQDANLMITTLLEDIAISALLCGHLLQIKDIIALDMQHGSFQVNIRLKKEFVIHSQDHVHITHLAIKTLSMLKLTPATVQKSTKETMDAQTPLLTMLILISSHATHTA
jgi:hypothetical protein